MIEVQEAARIILEAVSQTTTESVPLDQAVGRFLREDVLTDRALPPYDRSMMDGYAFNFAAWKAKEFPSLKIVGEALAGHPAQVLSSDGVGVFAIMTGAVVPLGADTVVKMEDTKASGIEVTVLSPQEVEQGQFIHRKGNDSDAGKVFLRKGHRIHPPAIAALASCGYSKVKVARKVRVGIYSSGDEVVPIDQQPLPHQIRQSNGIALKASLEASGCAVVSELEHLPDDPAVTRRRLEDALDHCDWLVLTGGVAKGKHDYVKSSLLEMGAEVIFQGVSQRPGKPMLFARMREKLIFALPGNANSCLICCHRYLLPALQRALGGGVTQVVKKELASDFSFGPPLTFFLPVQIDLEGKAVSLPPQNSGDFLSMVASDGFLELSSDRTTFRKGEFFDYWRF